MQQREELQNILEECSKMDSKINDTHGNGRMVVLFNLIMNGLEFFLILQREQELREKLDSSKQKCYDLTMELESMLSLAELNSKIVEVTK